MGRIARFELLEPRRLLSVSLNAQSGLLTISGTAVGDVVSITQPSTTLTVVDAGTSQNFTAAQVQQIQVTLGSGADKVTIATAVTAPASVSAGSGNDTLIAGGGATTLIAGGGNDYLLAGSAATMFIGGGGIDTYAFGVAAVTPASPPSPIIYTISPGTGKSSLDFTAMPASAGKVNVDLTNDAALAKFAGRTIQTALAGQAGLFTVVLGGAGDDDFVANSANDSLVGGSGNNTLVAGSGNDTLAGNGTSNDYVFKPQTTSANYILNQPKAGGAGNNVLDFSALTPSDPLIVNLLYDYMAVYDNVTIHDGAAGQFKNFNEILDGAGDDIITANNTGDVILGGNGADTLTGGTGPDLFFLGSGFNVVSGEGGSDTVLGSTGNYDIYAVDYLSDPTLASPAKQAATNASFQVFAGSGNASIVGGAGNDTLEGSGNDTIHGMAGNDYIQGGDGPSLLFGDAGNDSLLAGLGDTTIVGGAGFDTITCGEAGGVTNFIDKNIPDNASTAAGDAVIDSVALTANAIAAAQGLATPTYPFVGTPGTGAGDTVTGKSANMIVIGGLGDDVVDGGDGPSTIIGGSGTDLLVGGFGQDVIQGGAGADTILAGFGPDILTGGSGNTVFQNVNGFSDTVTGGSGFNSATIDPTGTSVFTNIQLFYNPTYLPGQTPMSVAASQAAATAPLLQPAVAPSTLAPSALAPAALAPPTLAGGVLTVGSTTYPGGQSISVVQAGGTVTVTEAMVGTFSYPAASITREVVVRGGPGDDFMDLDTLTIPATVNTGGSSPSGFNFVSGGANETITGGNGNDSLVGGLGHNVISGGAGTNVIYGGTGNDSITGGPGFDYFYPGGFGVNIQNDTEADTIKAGTGTETLYMEGNLDPLDVRLDKGTITDLATGARTLVSGPLKNFYGGVGDSTIVTTTVRYFEAIAGSGSDTLYGTGFGDLLQGGYGNSFVYADSVMQIVDLRFESPSSIGHYARGAASNLPDVHSYDVPVALLHPPA